MARALGRTIQGFGGGVFMFSNPSVDQAYNISNMLIDPDGRAYKRQGSALQTHIPPLGVQILSLFVWYRQGAPTQILAHGGDGHLYYTTNLTSWTDGGSGLATTNPASFEVAFSDSLVATAVYIADGVNPLKRWSGTALQVVAGSPAAKYLCWWKDTLFALGTPTNPDGLYSSDAAKADTWPAPNFLFIGKGDGDVGSALFTASQELIVGKKRRTFVLVSPSTFENRVVDYEKGCESHWSVVKFDSEIYYITRYGIVRYIQGAPAELISGNIQPLFSTIFLNLARLEQCFGYRIHHRVGWTLVRQGQSLPDFQIEYYPQYPRRPWTFHRMPARCWVTLRDTGERLFFAKSDFTGPNPNLYEAFKFGAMKDDDKTFQGMIETLWDDLGDPVNRKYLRAIRVWGDGRIYFQVKHDRRDDAGQLLVANLDPIGDPKWNEGGDKWDAKTDIWGSVGTIGTDIVYPDQYGRQFAIRLYDLSPEEEVELGGRRDVADLIYGHPRGWSLLQLTLEAVQMGELG